MEDTLRVAVIGRTGKGDYGHGLDTVWLHTAGVEIVAVADDDAAGRAKAQERLRAPRSYADYREMLARERPQIVSVAQRWIDAHHDMVVACAEHGASVLLEKPMCGTLAEADRMVAACERSHVKLAISHQNRYNPRVLAARDLILAGEIGEVLELRGRGKEDHRGGGEDLWVLGTHVLDMMRLIGGDSRWCFARVLQDGRPVTRADVREGNEGIGPLAGDQIDAVYGMSGGATAYFSSRRGRAGKPPRFGLCVYGTRGAVEIAETTNTGAHILRDPSWSPGRSGARWEEIPVQPTGDAEGIDGSLDAQNRRIARDLIAAIREDRQPRGGIYEARAATEMIAAVFESHRRRGPVSFPLENRENPLLGLEG